MTKRLTDEQMQRDAAAFREGLLMAAARERLTRAIDDAWHWFQAHQDNEDVFDLHDQKQCLMALVEAMHWQALNVEAEKHEFAAQQEKLEGIVLPFMAKFQLAGAGVPASGSSGGGKRGPPSGTGGSGNRGTTDSN